MVVHTRSQKAAQALLLQQRKEEEEKEEDEKEEVEKEKEEDEAWAARERDRADDEPQLDECAICYETLTTSTSGRIIPTDLYCVGECNHSMCTGCFIQHVIAFYKRSCHICRGPVSFSPQNEASLEEQASPELSVILRAAKQLAGAQQHAQQVAVIDAHINEGLVQLSTSPGLLVAHFRHLSVRYGAVAVWATATSDVDAQATTNIDEHLRQLNYRVGAILVLTVHDGNLTNDQAAANLIEFIIQLADRHHGVVVSSVLLTRHA
jgi:hypothetical protein